MHVDKPVETNYCEGHVYIRGHVFGQLGNLLVDTGAARSLIKLEYLSNLKTPPNLKWIHTKCKLKGVSGVKVDSVGIVKNVPITIDSCEILTDFIVVETLGEDVILGIDFINDIQGKLDYKSRTLSNDQFCTKLLELEPKNSRVLYNLCTVTATSVASEEIVKCRVSGLSNFEPDNFVYYPDSELWQGGDLLKSEGCPVTLTQPEMYTKIYNPNRNPIVIPKGTILGKFCLDQPSVNFCQNEPSDSRKTDDAKLAALNIDNNSNLTPEQKVRLKTLVRDYIDIFALNRSEIGVCNILEHEIKTTTNQPVRSKFRKIPLHMLKDVEAEVSDLLAHGIIEPSESPYSSPAMVIKRNNKTRLILDYRDLNKVIDRSWNPLPASSTLLAQLGTKNKYYSNIDMKDGYFQVKLTKESRHKTAFSLPLIGHYHFLRAPLGISSAPAMFQGLIDQLLKNLKGSVALGYLDDIISAARNFDEGLKKLKILFERFREANLKLNPNKCMFMVKRLKFLGTWISEDGLSPDGDKISAITEMSAPRTKRQCQSFLGCVNFFRNHIKDLAAVLKPLSDTLVGPKFVWTPQAQSAFELAKKALVAAELLIFPDTEKPIHLFTDSSEIALGGALMQLVDDHYKPICYSSRVLNPAERNYATVKKELLGLKHFVKLWYYYLIGKKFIAHVDARALTAKNLLTNTNCSTILRWLLELSEFEFDIVYQPGATHCVADALSRLPAKSDQFYNWYMAEVNPDRPREAVIRVAQISQPVEKYISWAELQREDQTLTKVIDWVKAGKRPVKLVNFEKMALKSYYEKFKLLCLDLQDCLVYEFFSVKSQKSRKLRCVPEHIQSEIMELNHENPTAGHLGYEKCLERIRSRYYWPSMMQDIEKYTQLCEICYRTNLKYFKRPKAPLGIFTANYPGEFLCCDLIGPLTPSNGKRWIVTMTDKFSRYAHAAAITTAESSNIAQVILNTWISNEGLFRVLLTDQGANLTTSNIMKEIFNVLQVDKRKTTAYKPSTNGLVERFNRSLVNILKKYIQEFPNTWSEKLPLACLAHNTAFNASTKATPFLLMRGRDCILPHDLLFDTQTTEFYRDQQQYMSKIYFEIRKIWDLARANNLKYTMQAKMRYDRNADFVTYKKDDLVLLWKPIKDTTFRKFRNNFIGPLSVVDKISDYNYKVIDPKNGKMLVVNFESLRYYDPKLRRQGPANREKISRDIQINNRQPDSDESGDDIVVTTPTVEVVAASSEQGVNQDASAEATGPIQPAEIPVEPSPTEAAAGASSTGTSRAGRVRMPVQPMQVKWGSQSYI